MLSGRFGRPQGWSWQGWWWWWVCWSIGARVGARWPRPEERETRLQPAPNAQHHHPHHHRCHHRHYWHFSWKISSLCTGYIKFLLAIDCKQEVSDTLPTVKNIKMGGSPIRQDPQWWGWSWPRVPNILMRDRKKGKRGSGVVVGGGGGGGVERRGRRRKARLSSSREGEGQQKLPGVQRSTQPYSDTLTTHLHKKIPKPTQIPDHLNENLFTIWLPSYPATCPPGVPV